MSQNIQPACIVCGGLDFIADAGFFFCLECNTQSQDVREEVYDEYFGANKGTSRILKKKPKEKDSSQDTKLTSWEVLNYVLKGITDELIILGASPELKIVTLQLWASYLRRLEVAFTSVEIERKPKLGYAFKRSDAEIVYGITKKQLKEKTWRSRSRGSSAGSIVSNSSGSDTAASTSTAGLTRRSIMRRLAIRKRALASAEYKKSSQEMTQSLSQTLEELDSSSGTADTPKRMKITKFTKSLLNSSSASSADEERNVRRRLTRHEGQSVRNVTTAKVVALINVALAVTRQDIQVSDFLRWVEEGHISLGTSRKFLPEDMKVDSQTLRAIEIDHLSYVKSQQLVVGMCDTLGIEELPSPDLGKLAERYCLELQLPGEVVGLVKRLVVLSCSKVSHNSVYGCHISRHCEVQVISAVIVVLKLLFSLDDCTEHRLSHTAAQINRESCAEGEGRSLFVWSDWVQFVECRKAVVSSHHLPTRTAVYGAALGRDSALFLQHYEHLPNNRETSKRYALNKRWAEALTKCLGNLTEESAERADVEFPASLTPLHSCTQHLLTHHAELIAPVVALLSIDFTSHSMDHILNPNRTVAIGLANDLNIIQREGSAAIFQEENISPRDQNCLVIPRFKVNQVNMTVNIVKHINPKRKTDQTIIPKNQSREGSLQEKRTSDLKEIVSDDSDEELGDNEVVGDKPQEDHCVPTCHTTLELFNTGSQYWFCHCNLGKNSVSLDEFEVFAMKALPSSFLWLLKESSRMIGVPTKDIYANVVSIEKKYKFILNEEYFFERKRKRKRS